MVIWIVVLRNPPTQGPRFAPTYVSPVDSLMITYVKNRSRIPSNLRFAAANKQPTALPLELLRISEGGSRLAKAQTATLSRSWRFSDPIHARLASKRFATAVPTSWGHADRQDSLQVGWRRVSVRAGHWND